MKYRKIYIQILMLFTTFLFIQKNLYAEETSVYCADESGAWHWLDNGNETVNGTWVLKNEYPFYKYHVFKLNKFEQYENLKEKCINQFGDSFIYPQAADNRFSAWIPFADSQNKPFPGHITHGICYNCWAMFVNPSSEVLHEIDRREVSDFDTKNGAVDLGMANVPVLNQGNHGTCPTFATTAAINAKLDSIIDPSLKKDKDCADYIDQQCILALTNGFAAKYGVTSSWEGESLFNPSTSALRLFKLHGFIKKGDCFGAAYPEPSQVISVNEYRSKSVKDYSDKIDYENYHLPSLNELKKSINAGNRVLLSTAISKEKVIGYNIPNLLGNGGLWACKQPGSEINNCEKIAGFHVVVVFGYDDKQKLLKIRNSWGEKAGYKGYFYMTYRYFYSMATKLTIIK